MFSFFSFASKNEPEKDDSDAGSDIEVVESEFNFENDEEKGNEFLDESIEKGQLNQQQSSLEASNQGGTIIIK